MNITKLEKASKLIERMKEVDQEVIALEKLADQIANKRSEIKLTLNVVDLEKKEKGEGVQFDEDGSIIKPHTVASIPYVLWGFGSGAGGNTSEKKEEKGEKFKQDISDTVALNIIGVLMFEKLEIRKAIFKQLEKLGVSC
jgi:hypothetical protein